MMCTLYHEEYLASLWATMLLTLTLMSRKTGSRLRMTLPPASETGMAGTVDNRVLDQDDVYVCS